jgi:hypothetical protein
MMSLLLYPLVSVLQFWRNWSVENYPKIVKVWHNFH